MVILGRDTSVDPILLITPDAMDERNAQLVQQALTVLRQATDVMVGTPTNPGELDSLLHRRGGRRVVVAGGDTNLQVVLAALHRRKELGRVEVALIPLGPSSDFALRAGIPLQPARSADLAAHGRARPVDALVDGAGALVVHAVNVGAGAPGRRLRIEADGQLLTDMDRPVDQVRISNGSIAPGARVAETLAPDHVSGNSRPSRTDGKDGLLDVVVAFATTPLRRIGRLVMPARRTGQQLREIAAVRAKQVSVTGPDFWIEADGAVVGPERSRTWRVEPDAIQLVLPAPPSPTW
jgi:diacylglycerol kinase (ATP)